MEPIKFILELDAKLGKLIQLDTLIGKVTSKLAKLDPTMKLATRTLNVFLAGVNAGSRVLHAFGAGLGFIGSKVGAFARDTLAHFTALASFNGLRALTAGTIEFGKSLVRTIAATERQDTILRQLLGPENAKRISDYADKVASVTGIDSGVIKGSFGDLAMLGVSIDDLPSIAGFAADIAALRKEDPAQTFAEVTAAMEKLKRKGEIDLGILGKMGMTKEGFFKDFAAALGPGATPALVEEMNSKGLLDQSDILTQMIISLGKITKMAPAAFAELQGKGPDANLARIGQAPGNFMQSVANTPESARLNEQLARVAAMLDPNSPNGKKITEGLINMTGQFAQMLAETDLEKLTKNLVELFTVLPPLVRDAAAAFQLLAKALVWFGKGTQDKQDFTLAGRVLSGDKAAGAELNKALEANGITPLAPGESMFKGPIAEWLGLADKPKIEEAGAQLSAGLANGGTGNFDMVKDMGRAMVRSSLGGVIDEAQTHSPSRLFEHYGEMIPEGFAIGMENRSRELEAAGRNMIPAPSADLTLSPPKAGGRGGAGAVTISTPININYTGSGGAEAAQEIADAVKRILPGQLQYAFDRMRVEMGAG